MATFLFVHGTGVREKSYRSTLETVRTKLAELNERRKPGAAIRLAECLWGDPFGVNLNLKGDSIPDYHPDNGARLLPVTTSDEDLDLLLWSALGRDPLYELRELSRQDRERGGFGKAQLGAALLERFDAFELSPALLDALEASRLAGCFSDALSNFKASEVFRGTLGSLARTPHEVGNELARALMAATLMLARAAGIPAVPKQIRDELAAQIATGITGAKLGVGRWLAKTALEAVSPLLTREAVRNRTDLSNLASPATGDVLKYLARGNEIRGYIEAKIKEARDEVFLFAHSLGGVACVDLLVAKELPEVTRLITVGSQAPYLYEIDALWSMRPGRRLPESFRCRWLNVFDRHDFLSYKAEAVFGRDRVRDRETKSGLSFPESHSAYFKSDEVWQFIWEELG